MLIIGWHYTQHSANAPYGDEWAILTSYQTINSYIALILGSWGQLGVSLFIMVSAWFLCDTSYTKKSKIILLILQTWILSIIIYAVCLLSRNANFSVGAFLREILTPFFGQYWFITNYCIYLVLVPYINIFIKNNLGSLKKICILLTLFVPLYNNILDGPFGVISWFIYIHIVMTFLKQQKNNFFERNRYIGCILSIILVLLLEIFVISIPLFYSVSPESIKFLLERINGRCIFILLPALFLFFIFKNWNLAFHPIINTLAKATLTIYIFHENIVFRSSKNIGIPALLWDKLLHADFYFNTPYFFLHMIFCILLIYLLGTLIHLCGTFIADTFFKCAIDKIRLLDKKS